MGDEVDEYDGAWFEALAHFREDGSQFVYARDLVARLGYSVRGRHVPVLREAIVAAGNLGWDLAGDFRRPPVPLLPVRGEYELSPQACLLVALKADDRKSEVVRGVRHFARHLDRPVP